MPRQPVSGTAGARNRPAVRPWLLVVVLLGLFLMHGGPAAAGDGCHGAMQDTTATAATTPAKTSPALGSTPAKTSPTLGSTPAKTSPTLGSTPAGMPAATAAHPAGHPAGHPEAAGGKAVVRADGAGMRGALCLATTPRSEIPPPPVAAAAFVLPAALLLPWAGPASDGTRRRGPPAGGRPLLLQVCVART
ncbi:hypothetical protein AB5L52_20220 [Streptomyces sp. CG4]|uniref:hypothetical protein n=1 Tax=Streptomyces sp. CG4 TaxID=408783 RepID=UPI0034E25E4A